MERLPLPLKFKHYIGEEGNITCFKILNHSLGMFYFEWL